MAVNPEISRGVQDTQQKICAAQAIPVDGAADVSASSYDMLMTSPTYGVGTPLHLKVKITTAFGKSAGSPTLTIKPICDTVSGLGSASPLTAGIEIKDGEATAGKIYDIPLPMGSVNAKTRFLGASLTPSTTQFTAGNLDCWLSNN